VLTTRWLFLGSALLVFANVAFGDGTYQRTKNGKTLVWNNDPKPGDEASWSGDRDREGYASGFGTLTWYTAWQEPGSAKSALYARYWGNMVRGKFNGPVNAHSKGKTAYAIFADGVRTTRWAAGPAPSWKVAHQLTKPPKPETAAEPASEGSGVAGPEAPAKGRPPVQRSASGPEGPTPLREVRGQTSEITDRPTTQSVGKEREEPVRRQPETEAAAPAEGPSVSGQPPAQRGLRPGGRSEITDRPTAQTVDKEREEPVRRQPETEAAAPAEGPPVQRSASGPEVPTPRREDSEQPPAQRGLRPGGRSEITDRSAARAFPESATADKPEAESDNSVEELVGPSSSLRIKAVSDGSPAATNPEAASSPAASARLTEEEVVDLADAAARSRGYDPAQYWRPDPRYNPADKIWSLEYDQKAHYASGALGKHFTVTVDNKTKKASIPGR
jgi:hypothetical protein